MKNFLRIAYKFLACFCCIMVFSFTVICNTKPYKATALTGVDDATIAAGAVCILACVGIWAGFQYASKNDMQMTDSRVWSHVGDNIKTNLKTLAGGLEQAGKTIVHVGSDCINGVKSAMKSFVDDYKYVDADGNLQDKDIPSGVDAGFTNQTAVNVDQGQTWNWKNCPSSIFMQIIPGVNGTYTKTIGKTAVSLLVDDGGSHLTLTLSNGVVLTTNSGLYGGMNIMGNSQGYKYMCEYYIRGGADALHFISQAQIGGYDAWDEYDFGTWTISNYSGLSGQLQYNHSVLQIWEPNTTTYHDIGVANDYTGVENFLYKTLVDEQELPAPAFTISKAAYDALSVPVADATTTDLAVPGATEADVANSIDIANAVPNDVVPDFELTYDMSLPEMIFTKKFPFSIPYDIYNSIVTLAQPSVAPIFVVPINLPGYSINQSVTLDFTKVGGLIAIVRWGLSLLFLFGLMVVTRKLIGA